MSRLNSSEESESETSTPLRLPPEPLTGWETMPWRRTGAGPAETG